MKECLSETLKLEETEVEDCLQFCELNGITPLSATECKINARKVSLSKATISKRTSTFNMDNGMPKIDTLIMVLGELAKQQQQQVKQAMFDTLPEGNSLKQLFDGLLMVASYSYSQVTVIGYVKSPPEEDESEKFKRLEEFTDVLRKEEVSYLRIPDLPEPNGYFFTDRCIQLTPNAKAIIQTEYDKYKELMEGAGNKSKDVDSWFIGKIAEYFKSTPTQRVKEVGWNQKKVKAICYLSPTLLTHELKEDTGAGAWEEILERMDYREEFLAWVWVLFTGEKASSQVVWLYGTGNDGKSTISRVLSRILKNVSCSVNEFKNQFTHSKFYRKRLACWNDSRDLNVVDDAIIFQVTGGDKGDIEEKGKSSFQGEHNCMILATSNYYPKIDVNSPAHLRRILLIDLANIKNVDKTFFSDVGFEDALYYDRYKLMARAKEAHDRLAKKHYPADKNKVLVNIPLRESLKKKIKEKSRNRFTQSAEKFFKEKLQLMEGGTIEELTLQKKFSQFQERKGITTKNAHPTMGYGFLKNLLLAKGCKDVGDGIEGITTKGGNSFEDFNNELLDVEDLF